MRRDNHPHKDRFDQLKAHVGSHHQRGREFERLLADVFRRAHFRVDRSVGSARPRQTDLLATTPAETLLIECKWRKRRAGSDDVDALRSRLARVPGPVTGVLISVSGFTSEAIREVEVGREQPILLFGEEELADVTDRWGDLRQMLRLKSQRLLIDGRVHLLAINSDRTTAQQQSIGPITDGDEYLVGSTGRVPWVAAPGGFGQFTFARDLSFESISGDASVAFDLPLASLSVQNDLVWALSELSALGWTTGEGHWCLQQADTNWHGVGAATLVDALAQREARYRSAGGIHHTEELTYYDQCEGGFYTLTADLDSADGDVSHAALSIHLGGVPFDQQPLQELCRTFDVLAPLSFRPRARESVANGSSFSRGAFRVEPVALIVHEDLDDPDDPLWVCGLVAPNPLLDLSPNAWEALPDAPWLLREAGLVLCVVRDWHPLSQQHTYRLEHCRWAHTSDATVVRVVVNWPDSELPMAR